jgi:hypothetical protein
MGKNRKQASLTNVVQYDSNFNLSIGTSTSSSFNSSGSIIAASGFTGSLSGSVFGLGNTVSFSSSVSSDLINLETKSASVDISISSINTFTASNNITSLNSKTGSYATTGSNSFYGTQVFSGSVYIATDLIVQGSSSIQYISASSVSIGTNIVQLNTATPSVRYAGISVQDSGSSAGVTGSMLWDSLCNRWIYSNPSTIGYSGGILMSGPRAATFGTETTLTCNYIAKSGGGDHLYDSCIWEMSGSVGINCATPSYNLDVNGCGRFSGAVTAAGAIFTSATETRGNIRTTFTSDNSYYSLFSNDGALTLDTYGTGGYMNFKILGSTKLSIASTGAASFSSSVNINGASTTNDLNIYNTNNAGISLQTSYTGTTGSDGFYMGQLFQSTNFLFRQRENADIVFDTNNGCERMRITSGGMVCFACQVCTAGLYSNCAIGINSYNSAIPLQIKRWTGSSGTVILIGNDNVVGMPALSFCNDNGGGTAYVSMTSNCQININGSIYACPSGNVGIGITTPCTRVHVEGGYGSRWGGDGCFYGGGVSGGGMPYGDVYGNGASYTYQTCNGNSNNSSLYGGFAAGYFKGGPGTDYGGGGAGIVAIGGNGGNAESVNAGGGAGIFARAGTNGAGSAHSYAGWFDGGNVIVRCGNVGVGTTSPLSLLQVGCVGNSTIRLGTSSSTNTSASYAFGAWNNSGGDILTVRGDGLVAFAKINDFTTGNAPNTWINPGSSWGIYINTSSCRYKRNISNYDKGVDIVNQLRPVYYKGTSEVDGDKQFVGLIAEEIHDLGLTEFVNYNDEGLPNSLSYPNMIALAFNAIKEQQCTINLLKSCIGIV